MSGGHDCSRAVCVCPTIRLQPPLDLFVRLTPRIVIPSEARDLLFGCVHAGLLQIATYSYRNASTGSSFAACIAGTQPLITPTTTRISVESTMVISDKFRWISTFPESSSYAGPRNGSVPIDDVKIHENSIPIAPAASVSTSAS